LKEGLTASGRDKLQRKRERERERDAEREREREIEKNRKGVREGEEHLQYIALAFSS